MMKKRLGGLYLDIRKAEETAADELSTAVKVGTVPIETGITAAFELTYIDSSVYLSSNKTQFYNNLDLDTAC